MTTSWHSYPKILTLGHRALEGLFEGPVIVEEKIDGSQFSFGKFNGELRFRSKGQEFAAGYAPKMFQRAVDTVVAMADLLVVGWTYRGEVLDKPKHNTLAYDRVPAGNFIGFDISTGPEYYLDANTKRAQFTLLGLETVPLIYKGEIGPRSALEGLRSFLDRPSCLGGQKIEGVVVKNYHRYGPDGHVLMGKLVSEAFKESNKKEFRAANPTKGDVVELITKGLRTPARWEKAIQHRRDSGQLVNAPQDIGPLLKEIAADTREELGEEIKETLFKWAWPHISRGITAGFPEYYKAKLAEEVQV